MEVKGNILKILLIPVENVNHPEADIRLVPTMSVLSKKGEIVGLEFIHEITFESSRDLFTKKKLIGYINLIFYLIKTLTYGLRHLKRIDLIFCEHLYSTLVGSVLSVVGRKPCIWDSHGNLLEACRQLNNSNFYTKLTMLLENMMKKIPKVIVVPTELDKQLYIKQGFEPNKIVVIPVGVDLSVIKKIMGDKSKIRERLGLSLNKKILIFTGSRTYFPNKEAAYWINNELAQAIVENFNDVQIIITGHGETPLDVNPIVTFTGFVPNIYEYIFASDLCLAPVILDNGISTKLLDFMSCGRPAIVLPSTVKGMPQLVDGKNIIIAKDKDEFIVKTIDTLNALDTAKEIGLNARKIIEKYYNWEVLQEEWSKLIDKTLTNVS